AVNRAAEAIRDFVRVERGVADGAQAAVAAPRPRHHPMSRQQEESAGRRAWTRRPAAPLLPGPSRSKSCVLLEPSSHEKRNPFVRPWFKQARQIRQEMH